MEKTIENSVIEFKDLLSSRFKQGHVQFRIIKYYYMDKDPKLVAKMLGEKVKDIKEAYKILEQILKIERVNKDIIH
ncbi:MAG: hypothetical protein KKB88_00110 [Nanoarchaeota archaeon]|nr:hypothetical protein [Nanoarchaeota archaeon]